LGFWFLGFDGIGWDSNFWDFHFPTSFGLTFGLNLLNQIDTDWHFFEFFQQVFSSNWRFLRVSPTIRKSSGCSCRWWRAFLRCTKVFFSGQMRHEKSLGGRLY
jgi:hypothetical protein